jgi:hypothetical protein
MHPKIRKSVEDQIAMLERGIEHAPYLRQSVDEPFVAACIQQLADKRGLSFDEAVEPFIQQHIDLSNWRIGQLQEMLTKAQ